MTKDEALKMAIEWAEGWYGYSPSKDALLKACRKALEQPAMTYEQGFDHGYEAHGAEQMADACKEALEQPAQEPIAWMNDEGFGLYPTNDTAIPLYTHPHQVDLDAEYSKGFDAGYEARFESESKSWQGLTDDEIRKIWFALEHELGTNILYGVKISRAIEQALKEKNT